MKIETILNEATYEKEVLAITNTLITLINKKIKEEKKYNLNVRNITELFKKYADTKDIRIYLTYNLLSPRRQVETIPNGSVIDIVIKDNYIYNEKLNEKVFFESLSHEVIHALDFLRAENKVGKAKKSLHKEELRKDPSHSHAYYNDDYEFNVLINKVKVEAKLNKTFRERLKEFGKDYKSMNKLLAYTEFGRFIPKYFLKDEDFKKKLYKRLVREKLI